MYQNTVCKDKQIRFKLAFVLPEDIQCVVIEDKELMEDENYANEAQRIKKLMPEAKKANPFLKTIDELIEEQFCLEN